jgi:hypothetical protein
MVNIRENIHEVYQQYQSETNTETAAALERRGIVGLSKYFSLILFQSYLDSNPPGLSRELVSFKNWLNRYPEIETIKEGLCVLDPHPLAPVPEFESKDLEFGMEEEVVVNRRRGAVVAKGTIIKVTLFDYSMMCSRARNFYHWQSELKDYITSAALNCQVLGSPSNFGRNPAQYRRLGYFLKHAGTSLLASSGSECHQRKGLGGY